jgi:hypothetical protein
MRHHYYRLLLWVPIFAINLYLAYKRANDSSGKADPRAGVTTLFHGEK